MLKKPVVTEVRTPTNTWSGLGFSKSMPAETIKELRRANHVSYKPSMTTTYEVCKTAIQYKQAKNCPPNLEHCSDLASLVPRWSWHGESILPF